jgi:DNA-binding FadR family transcriptional regulator
MSSNGEVERVRRALLGRIVGGDWPPGVRLPAETDLASELGCGRSTIREALGQLAALGVVVSRRGSGAHVLDWRREGSPALLPYYLGVPAGLADAPRMLRELLRMRRLLAGEAVRLAARYGDADGIAAVRRMLESSKQTTDPAVHALRELDVFRGLVVSSGIWPAVWFANAFWGPMRELHGLLAPIAGGPPADYDAAMSRLVDLVAARDEARALAHLERWLDKVDRELEGRLVAAFGAEAPPVRGGPAPGAKQPAAHRTKPTVRTQGARR